MTSQISQGGFTFSKVSVGGWWRWTIEANNTQGANQQYYVRDINTPFGRITDGVDIPIPGDVVIDMANSLAQFQQQLSPLIALASGQQTTLNVTITQCDPASSIGSVNFINAGAFGSFMTASATPTVPWISATPTVIAGIGQNQPGQFTVMVDPSMLLSSNSPYSGVLNLQDNRQIPTVIPITMNITVLPQPIISTNPSFPNSVSFNWNLLTASGNSPQSLIVSNSGPSTSILNFTVAKVNNNSPWLSFSPASGYNIQSGSQLSISLCLNPYGIPQIDGEYFETLLISSPNAFNSPLAVQVTLTVSGGPCPPDSDRGVPAEWEGGNYEGGPGEPYENGPGNQPYPGAGWADPPSPGNPYWRRK